jgi:hypothetical protein
MKYKQYVFLLSEALELQVPLKAKKPISNTLAAPATMGQQGNIIRY